MFSPPRSAAASSANPEVFTSDMVKMEVWARNPEAQPRLPELQAGAAPRLSRPGTRSAWRFVLLRAGEEGGGRREGEGIAAPRGWRGLAGRHCSLLGAVPRRRTGGRRAGRLHNPSDRRLCFFPCRAGASVREQPDGDVSVALLLSAGTEEPVSCARSLLRGKCLRNSPLD